MPWRSLGQRFADLPLILCGPILRRVDNAGVSIWLALREARRVTLDVFSIAGSEPGEGLFQGTAETVRLGKHLHVVVVRAQPAPGVPPLPAGKLYTYDLSFVPLEASAPVERLRDPGIFNTGGDLTIAYQGFSLPTFMTPPDAAEQLRIFHASCRKPHGEGRDMLAWLDELIASVAHEETRRPQQLLLTGDQIYADDVAAPLLAIIQDATAVLLPDLANEEVPMGDSSPHHLLPGCRQQLVQEQARLTSGEASSHLITFGEYACMYLFAWSDLLWPEHPPTASDVLGGGGWGWLGLLRAWTDAEGDEALRRRAVRQYHEDEEALLGGEHPFPRDLAKVRRVLANMPTLMVFDDHEVTDDWNLNGAWTRRVMEAPLGRRILRNGLLGYALFQGWGNDPEYFQAGAGERFLRAAARWQGGARGGSAEALEEALGLSGWRRFSGSGTLPRTVSTLRWHFVVHAPAHRVLFLNTRTRRGFPTSQSRADLIVRREIDHQLGLLDEEGEGVTFVVSAAPIFEQPLIRSLQKTASGLKGPFATDDEAWSGGIEARAHLVTSLLQRGNTIVLSGDVHYGFGSLLRAQHWSEGSPVGCIVNFTSSSLRNQNGLSLKLMLVRPDPADEERDVWDDHEHIITQLWRQLPFFEGGAPDPEKGLEPRLHEVHPEKSPAHPWDQPAEEGFIVGYVNLGELRVAPRERLALQRLWHSDRQGNLPLPRSEYRAYF